jgi:hypothetical protein
VGREVSAAATQPQWRDALDVANERRRARAQQRRELRQASIREVVPALIDPTPELGSYRIGHLFGKPTHGVIPGFSEASLQGVLSSLALDTDWREITETHFLGDLTERERRRLVRAIVAAAPRSWRVAA